jgi:hypothetical protein
MAILINTTSLPVEAKWPLYVQKHSSLKTPYLPPHKALMRFFTIPIIYSNYSSVKNQQAGLFHERTISFLLVNK